MRFRNYRVAIFLSGSLLVASNVLAQVDAIKNSSASSSRTRSSGGERGSRSSGMFAYVFIDLIGSGIVEWQRYKLDKKQVNPSIISLEVLMQAAMQPSSYYVFNPRIRGTWGLFSTDYRINYLVEEDINGYKDLATLDWQILQLNLITTRNVIGRVGFGMMAENFGDYRSFGEGTVALQLYSNSRLFNGTIEYRNASDWEGFITPRREFSAYVEQQFFEHGRAHAYVTVGGMYQRYYESIDVWGIQSGVVFKLF